MKLKNGDLLLGIDPGYSNLGLAIIKVTSKGPRVVTGRILGIKSSKHWSPGKELVGQATALLTEEPSDGRTNHENDAIMAAIAAFLPKEINKAKERWAKQTS